MSRFHPTRRGVLAGASALLATLVLPRRSWAVTPPHRLGFPSLMDATRSRKVDLVAAWGETEFVAGAASRTAGFNASYLGPVLRLAQGDTEIAVRNEMDQAISSHWHGMVIPGEVDGGPHQPIAPGQTWTIVMPVDQPPGPAWFHSHMHGQTARQVYTGLAGSIQISDGQDGARGLPEAYGVDDLTLVLQDRHFDGTGRMIYDPSPHDQIMGFEGDAVLVNGQLGGTAVIPDAIIRLRLLNGSNARIFDLAFASGRPLHLIATDGGYLPAPQSIGRLTLAPGERAEVLVDFTSVESDMLVSSIVVNTMMAGGRAGGMMGGMMGGGAERMDILAFATDPQMAARIDRLPDDLGGSWPDFDGRGAPLREFSLDMTMDGMADGMAGAMTGGGTHAINGRSHDMGRIDFAAKVGQVERWRIVAPLMMHPFHVHGTRFQVVTENGQPPRAQNRGWKDTVLVDGTTDILVRFDQKAPQNAPYMYHCHILEHEDGGMMGQFTVA